MMTAVRQTATVTAEGRLDVAVPELAPGTVADVIVLVPSPDLPLERPQQTPVERLAEIDRLRSQVTLTPERAARWIEEIRLERLAWRLPGDEPVR